MRARSACPSRDRRIHRAAALFAWGLSWIFILAPPPAGACDGTPPPPFCGKTLVLSQGAPSTLLLPGGGTFDVPVTVYFQMFDFPAGTGLCPGGPYAVDVDLTVTCTPAGDGGGSLSGAAIVFGYNDFAIPVTLPAGPPRICAVDGTATVTLADGMVLEARNDSMLCLAEPAPRDPGLPRLDLSLTAGEPIAKVHPGDQAAHIYRISNNDPSASFSGLLGIELVNSSRLPGTSGPMPPGTGVFAISSPGDADNFPIGLQDDLVEGCLPLSRDPALPIVPTIEEPILLPPGAFIDVEVFSRPWGMCADGSCGRAKLVVDGVFSDASDGLACSGFVTAGDIAAPPTYLWPDSGQVGLFLPLPDPLLGALKVQGQPTPELGVELDIQLQQPLLAIDGGVPQPAEQRIGDLFNPERGRLQARFDEQFSADSFFDIAYRIDFVPNPPEVEIEIVDLQLVSAAPIGFETIAPFALIDIGIRLPGNPDFDAFGQMTWQISGQGVDDTDQRRDLIFESIQLIPAGGGFDVQLNGRVAPGAGNQIGGLDLNGDPRFFFAQQIDPFAEIFSDGFESGNLSAWSSSTP